MEEALRHLARALDAATCQEIRLALANLEAARAMLESMRELPDWPLVREVLERLEEAIEELKAAESAACR